MRACQVRSRILLQRTIQCNQKRHNSLASAGGSAGKGILKTLTALLLAGGGGAAVYTQFDDDWKKYVTDCIDSVQNQYRQFTTPVPPDVQEPSKLKHVKPIQGAQEIKSVNVEPNIKSKDIISDTKVEPSEPVTPVVKSEETLLSERVTNISENFDAFDVQTHLVARKIAEHRDALKIALDNSISRDDKWQDVEKARLAKNAILTELQNICSELDISMKDLEHKLEQYSQRRNRDKELFKKSKDFKYSTKKNFERKRQELYNLNNNLNFYADFAGLLEKEREQFENEYNNIHSDSMFSVDDLKNEELRAMLKQSFRKLDDLRSQYIEQQLKWAHKAEDMMKTAEDQSQYFTERRIDAERENLQHSYIKEVDQLLKVKQSKYEEDLRTHLQRQAKIHAESISEMLSDAENTARIKYEKALRNARAQMDEDYISSITSALAKLRAVEESLEKRSDTEAAASRSHELWLACQSLRSAVINGDEGLSTAIARVKELSHNDDFINKILSTIHQSESTNELLDRFEKVASHCRSVCLVDEAHHGVYAHFVSWVYSFFNPKKLPAPLEFDVDKCTDVELIAWATDAIQKGDLGLSVKYMRQLNSEAKLLASDWIIAVCTHLESCQGADILTSYASAVGFGALMASIINKEH